MSNILDAIYKSASDRGLEMTFEVTEIDDTEIVYDQKDAPNAQALSALIWSFNVVTINLWNESGETWIMLFIDEVNCGRIENCLVFQESPTFESVTGIDLGGF